MEADDVSRLRRVVTKLSRQLNASATDAGLTPTQASVLGLVAARGPLNLGALNALEHLNPTMLSRVISKLDAAGLIRRTSDPSDQRSSVVEITILGAEVSEGIRSRRTAVVSAHLDALPESHTRTIIHALTALEALADQFNNPPARDGGSAD